MVYHDPFRRLVFSGTLYDVEGWSCTLSMGHQGIGDGVNPGLVSVGIRNAAAAFFSSSFIGSCAKLTTIKYNLIDVNGHYAVPTESIRYDYESPVPGSGSATALAQAALCISLRTANARGYAHAGRFFTPACALANSADGRVSESTIANLAESVSDFLNALNADDSEWRLAIESNVGIGYQNHITHPRVGRVIDTMRSRRTALPEGYIDGSTLDA